MPSCGGDPGVRGVAEDDLPAPVASAIERIYEAGFDSSLWQQGLAAFCGAVGAHSAVTVPRVAAENTLFLPCTEGSEDFLQAFVDEGWYKRDLRAERGWPLTDRGVPVVLEQDIVTPEDHRREPMYRDFYQRYGVLWWAGITFRSLENQYVVSLARRIDQEPFSETDRRLFQRVTGHLSRALTIAERLATAAGKGGLQLLEALDCGGILVDASARVLAFNTTAESLLGEGIAIRGNRVTAAAPDSNRALQALIGRTLRDGPQPEGAIAVKRPLRRPILVDVLPIPSEAGAPFLFGRALLMLVDLDARPVPTEATLARLFGLTPREAAFAVQLAGGCNLAEAAECLGITRETARSHLKSIFSKTDTNRQSELVALLQRASGFRADFPGRHPFG